MGGVLAKLFRRPPAQAATVPLGTVVYAVGDVHGCANLLARLLDDLMADAAATEAQRKVLVFLGDYVDRGPDSKGVIDQLTALSKYPDIEARFLRGNHDETLLQFLDDPSLGPTWCDYGGRETLISYGVQPPVGRKATVGWAAAADAFRRALPAEHLAFLQATEHSLSIGHYFFCHAGARPGTPLHRQAAQDLMWIREPFLTDDRKFEQVVVHGHTPDEHVSSDARRIGIDTGAYATGMLTAARLEGEARSFLQAVSSGRASAPFRPPPHRQVAGLLRAPRLMGQEIRRHSPPAQRGEAND